MPPKTPRSHVRQPRRFKVTTPQLAAFTLDVGFGGLCLETMKALPRGSQVSGSVYINGQDWAFEGVVAWAAAGDPRLNQRARSGIRFTKVADGLNQALKLTPTLTPPQPRPPMAARPRPESIPTPSTSGHRQEATVSLEGEAWVVHTKSGGRVQEFRCVQEADARRLAVMLAG